GEGTLWSRACLNLRRRRGGGHAARYYTRRAGPEGSRPTFFRNFARPLGELQVGWGYLTVLASFAGIFPWSRSSAGARLGKSPLLAQKRVELGGDATAGGGISEALGADGDARRADGEEIARIAPGRDP